jgi:hypothetical protein
MRYHHPVGSPSGDASGEWLTSRLRNLLLIAAGAAGLSACADYGRGMSIGYGPDGTCEPYGGGCYGDYGYDYAGYGGDSWFGWYDDYYYPGIGSWVYDRYGRRQQWRDSDRLHWQGRRGHWKDRDWNDSRWQHWDGYRRQGNHARQSEAGRGVEGGSIGRTSKSRSWQNRSGTNGDGSSTRDDRQNRRGGHEPSRGWSHGSGGGGGNHAESRSGGGNSGGEHHGGGPGGGHHGGGGSSGGGHHGGDGSGGGHRGGDGGGGGHRGGDGDRRQPH